MLVLEKHPGLDKLYAKCFVEDCIFNKFGFEIDDLRASY